MEEVSEVAVKAEKAKARELRKSTWWANKIAQNARCYYCDKPLKAAECTMDHIVPLSRGGKSTRGNVCIACKACNNEKKDRIAIEWDEWVGR